VEGEITDDRLTAAWWDIGMQIRRRDLMFGAALRAFAQEPTFFSEVFRKPE
jgi:hypothetical protein